MSDHEELESLVAAWVLDALDPDEAETVRAHVAACAACREVAQRLRRVVGALPLVVEEVAPPARLRARVLAAATAPRAETPSLIAIRRRPSPGRRLLRPLSRRVPAFALAAVAVVALLAGALIGQVAFRGTTPAPATSQTARFTLTGHGDMSGARATVIDLKSDGIALVDFTGLPALDAGRVYEVWLIPATGKPVPAAVFVPDGNGSKVVIVNRSITGYSLMAVTNEAGPAGVAAPTQQPQLYGSLA